MQQLVSFCFLTVYYPDTVFKHLLLHFSIKCPLHCPSRGTHGKYAIISLLAAYLTMFYAPYWDVIRHDPFRNPQGFWETHWWDHERGLTCCGLDEEGGGRARRQARKRDVGDNVGGRWVLYSTKKKKGGGGVNIREPESTLLRCVFKRSKSHGI